MDAVEHAQRRRLIVLTFALAVFGLALVMALGASARVEAGVVRAVDVLQLLSPGLLAAGMARGILGPPLWLRDRRASRAVNDELARDNQRRAAIAGLIGAGATAFALTLTTPFLGLRAYEVAYALLFAPVFLSVARFVWLEVAGMTKAADAEQ